MKLEIERKFLVNDPSIVEHAAASPRRFLQGYLAQGDTTVRVRVAADAAWITIKSKPRGLTRLEYEYGIPVADARDMLDHLTLGTPIEKDRYLIEAAGFVWEVDVFLGANAPLVTAEVEIDREDIAVPLPPWLGTEVSADPRYTNSALASEPFGLWDHRSD